MKRVQNLEYLSPKSPIWEYMDWIDRSGNDRLFRDQYEHIVEEQKGQEGCFLTVVIRTQGNRPDMLQDVLTCLQGQTDPDFEMIIICHKAEKANAQKVRQIIGDQSPAFASKIRMIESDRGQRGAPVNLGFAHARGRYMVCLDDDDLVLDHWVQNFHEAEKDHAGMILHSWAVTQPWQAVTVQNGQRMLLSASGGMDSRYCVPYRTLNQQAENDCPFMGMAFPAFLFREMHILLNEELTTTEDWDYLLRTAGIAGVAETHKVTAIYRLWNTKDASRQMVQEPEWKDNYWQIEKKMQRVPILLSSKEVEECRDELTGLQSAGQKGRSCFMRVALLFWSSGEPFSDQQYTESSVVMRNGWIRAKFTIPEKSRDKQICRLRIDPAEQTLFALENIKVRLMDKNEVRMELTMKNIRETSGVTEGNRVLFLAEDPQIVMDIPEQVSFDAVVFTAKVIYQSSPTVIRWAADLCADTRWLAENRNIAHLYPDRGEGFQAEDSLECTDPFHGDAYEATFVFPPEKGSHIREIRFDPTEAGMLWLDDLQIRVSYQSGRKEELSISQIRWLNGFETGEGAAFIERDPYMHIPVDPGEVIDEIRITGKAIFTDTEKMLDLFSEAKRVPDYEMICKQLQEMRRNQWKERIGEGNE